MKIKGVEVKGSAEEFLVLPRPQGDDIVFHAVAVMDSTEFDRLCPMPTPKPMLKAGGWQENYDDPKYIEAINKQNELRFAWILLKSLEPSEIEWQTIEHDKPSSWLNWRTEFLDAGFNSTEVNRIISCVSSANSLDDAKLDEARENFLRGLAEASQKSTGPSTDQSDTQSGTPANG